VTGFATPGTWSWEDDESPEPPEVSVPYTGRLGNGVVRLSRLRAERRRFKLAVRLPPLETFLSRRREVDPLTLFLTWLGRQVGGARPGEVIDSASVYLCSPDRDRLIKLEQFWAERLTGDPSDAWVQIPNLAPLTLGDRRAPWAAPGMAYAAEGLIHSSNRP
jgi:hypothetical protein